MKFFIIVCWHILPLSINSTYADLDLAIFQLKFKLNYFSPYLLNQMLMKVRWSFICWQSEMESYKRLWTPALRDIVTDNGNNNGNMHSEN